VSTAVYAKTTRTQQFTKYNSYWLRYMESTILLRPGHSKNIFQDKKILKFHGHSSGHKTTQTRLKSAIKVI